MIATDNTMAGNENADAISSDGTSHGSCAIGVTHTYGYFLIASCFSVGYVEQCMPYFFLKIGSYRTQRNIEYLADAGEIFIQLLLGKFQDRGCLNLELSLHIPRNPKLIALCTWHFIPIAKTQIITHRCQN